MGISSIKHNMLMVNANRYMYVNEKKKAGSAEKLSSGEKVNRAADDAAGLSMSERMRWMIRGLNQGTENIQDGISWVQIGDGSLEEVSSMLNRMTELAVKSSSGTNMDSDRAMMQAEFARLQQEIDRLTDNTTFNEQHIFQEHEYPYHQIEGCTYWAPERLHTVREGENDLVMAYAKNAGDPVKKVSIQVDAGVYTTKELIDEMDTALEKAGLLDEGIYFEYTQEGRCNLHLEDGALIDDVSGGLSYLLYDHFDGGTLGALIGTTVFLTHDDSLLIKDGENDVISFKLLDPADPNEEEKPAEKVTLDLAGGTTYSKNALIQMLKEELKAKKINKEENGVFKETVKVDHYGTAIMMYSEDYIISEFEGNMFKVDDTTNFTSIFYDNIHPVQNVEYKPAEFEGAAVLQVVAYDSDGPIYQSSAYDYDTEASVFHITKGVNNLLVFNPNGQGEITLDLTDLDGQGKSLDGMRIWQACSALNDEMTRRFGAGSEPVVFSTVLPRSYTKTYNPNKREYQYIGYAGLKVQTSEAVIGESVGIDKAKSTAYNTLFTTSSQSIKSENARWGYDTVPDENCTVTGGRNLSGGLQVTAANNSFHLKVDPGLEADITLEAKNYSLADLVQALQTKIDEAFQSADAEFKDSQGRVLTVSSAGGHIVLTGATERAERIRVSEVAGNDGYSAIFPEQLWNRQEMSQSGVAVPTITLPEKANCDADGKNVTIASAYRYLEVTIDGSKRAKIDLFDGAPGKDGKWADLKALQDYITEKLKPVVEENGFYFGSTFNTLNVAGKRDFITMPANMEDKGKTYPTTPSGYTQTGKSTWSAPQGQAGVMLSNQAAKVETQKDFTASVNNPIKITAANNAFQFTKTINGVSTTFTAMLAEKEYTSLKDLKDDLQAAVNAANDVKEPDKTGGITVGIKEGGKGLTFTVGLNMENGGTTLGDYTTLSVSTTVGFLRDLHASKTSASVTVGARETLRSGKTFDRGINEQFTPAEDVSLDIKLSRPNAAGTDADEETVKVSLSQGTTYTRDSLKTAIDTALTGKGVTVSFDSSGRLVLTYDKQHAGDHYNIAVDKDSTALKYMFGYADSGYKSEKTYAAEGSATTVQNAFTLEASDNRSFSVTVDGKTYDVTLDAGDYGTGAGKKSIADEIKAKVNAAAQTEIGKDALSEVTVSNGGLRFKTASADGSNSRITMNYKSDSAMKKIFGSHQVAGAKAEFVKDASGGYKLKLTRYVDPTSPDPTPQISRKSIYVASDEISRDPDHSPWGTRNGHVGGSFILSESYDFAPDYEDGHHSKLHSYVQGVSLAAYNMLNSDGTITIDRYNNKLSFIYTQNSGSSYNKISVTLAEGRYTPDQLKDLLQDALDNEGGNAGKQVVTVQNGGIRIETVGTGNKYRIEKTVDNDCGGFYEKVLCSGNTIKRELDIKKDDPGMTTGGTVYAVGREDVKNKVVKIQRDGNDALSLNFTIPDGNLGKTKKLTLKMILDPGYYAGDELVHEIQGKLDDALEKEGLNRGLIEVGIGTVQNTTEIVGSINDRALTFKLSETVVGPGKGEYAIDGIGGTAAFSVFYATDGDIARAFVKGGRDISNGVDIRDGHNVLGLDVDDVTYEITLTPGHYTADELISHINDRLASAEDGAVPLKAYLDEGRLKLMHKKYGKHTIKHLTGGIKNQLFFSESFLRTGKQPMRLRASSVSGDWIEVDKPWMDTVSLGINTLTIEKYKNAQKAITRLKKAVEKAGNVRSYFGAMQNRLESTIRNNRNKAENTMAAESRIRDADFSKEIMENTIHSILEQSGASMMAQTKQNAQMALQLLI